MNGVIRIGTRASALAMAQTKQIAERIAKAAKADIELVPITTEGDTSRASLASLGGTGVFAAALREALLRGECDVVVHSLKDLPTAEHPGLRLGAVPKRADARDALCARDGLTLATLPEGARVGTGSPRRIAQLRAARPDVMAVDIRGNVDTRLGKVESGELDAVILAAAGLGRLGRTDAVTELLALDEWPTAAGQGALAIEVRRERGDRTLERALEAIDHGIDSRDGARRAARARRTRSRMRGSGWCERVHRRRTSLPHCERVQCRRDAAADELARRNPRQPFGRRPGGRGTRRRRSGRRGTPRQRRRRTCTT